MNINILIVDDQRHIREDLLNFSKSKFKDCNVLLAGSPQEAKLIILKTFIAIAFIDLKIDYGSELGGIEIITEIKKKNKDCKIIILSAWEPTDEIRNKLINLSIDGYITKGGQGNYIKKVLTEIASVVNNIPRKLCFVIMPFSSTATCNDNQWEDIFLTLIKHTVEEAGFGYTCERAALKIGNIIHDILEKLFYSDLVIADLTDRNANVFYELGVRHALKDKTVLIAQSFNHIPFDLKHYAAITYDYTTSKGRDEFKHSLIDCLTKIENGLYAQQIISPVRRYLHLDTN